MLNDPKGRSQIETLASQVSAAGWPSTAVFSRTFTASERLMVLRAMGKTARLDLLLSCEAWTEAAIELISLEVPAWRIKRLCFDDREWICTLTRFPDAPDWLDDSAESRHSNLALAILGALLAIRERAPTTLSPIMPRRTDVGADLTDYR